MSNHIEIVSLCYYRKYIPILLWVEVCKFFMLWLFSCDEGQQANTVVVKYIYSVLIPGRRLRNLPYL